MAVDKARAHLRAFGLDDRIMEFEVSSATVELAAKAVGCAPEMIAKTLSFIVGDNTVLIVAAGDARIDNTKFKAQFHTKAKMPPADQVEELVGHKAGGVCPFGVNDGVEVYLDASLRRFDIVYPAASSANSAVRLTVDELERSSGSLGWVDVCKNWE